jgi:hypothetical protein
VDPHPVQWLLAAVGLLGIVLGIDGAGWLLLAAPVFSSLAYLALWWTAREATVEVISAPSTDAATGWVFRWHDVLWLGNIVPALIMMSGASSVGRRTVSFVGPSPRPDARDARYLLVAPDAGDAAVLTASLLGREVA